MNVADLGNDGLSNEGTSLPVPEASSSAAWLVAVGAAAAILLISFAWTVCN